MLFNDSSNDSETSELVNKGTTEHSSERADISAAADEKKGKGKVVGAAALSPS